MTRKLKANWSSGKVGSRAQMTLSGSVLCLSDMHLSTCHTEWPSAVLGSYPTEYIPIKLQVIRAEGTQGGFAYICLRSVPIPEFIPVAKTMGESL